MTDQPRISPLSEADAPDDIKAIYAEVKEEIGHIPQSFQMMANHQEFFKSFWIQFKAVHAPFRIDKKTKTMLAVAMCAATNCQYCVNAQLRRLKSLGADDEEVTELFAVISFWRSLSQWNNAIGA